MLICFHVFVGWVVWYSGLLWLVIFAVVSRCDLMCKLHSVPQILDIYENNTTHYYSSATHLINNYKSSAPGDGHKVARNMFSNL